MKKSPTRFLIVTLFFISCGKFWEYEVNPPNDYRICSFSYLDLKLTNNVDTVSHAMNLLAKKDSVCKIPKGIELEMNQAVFDSVYAKFIYFSTYPKEVYRVDLLQKLEIALVLNIENPNSTFLSKRDLTTKEIIRIGDRFKTEYLPKLQMVYNRKKKESNN